MRENGWFPVRAQEQSIRTEARRGFQKHVVRFARLEHLQTWEKNQVRPEVVLVKSHDKSSAYQLHCGLFRLVCTNGMVVSDGSFQRISIKRSGFRFYVAAPHRGSQAARIFGLHNRGELMTIS
jgi:Domain of unknown function (DUF932)